jgi:acetyltransferase-like isoleucine patch superfamily enzyme
MLKRIVIFVKLCLAGMWIALRGTATRAAWISRGVHVARGVSIRQHAAQAIELEPGVSIGLGTLLLATTERSRLPAAMSRLSIGAGTAVNEYCNLRACGGEIRIGRQCLVAQMVTMVASNHSIDPGTPMIDQDWSTSPHSVIVGDDVWIGAGAILLPGARVGDGAVIAGGAVVRGEVPGNEIWGGVPARFLRRRGDASPAAGATATSVTI